jgi:hypothetical protein
MASTSTQVILTTPSDWRQWIQMIKSAAIQADIWEYVNPDTEKNDLPICEEPEEPTYRTVNPAAAAYKDLEDIEREELRDLRGTYKRKYKEYREQKTALGALIKSIQGTVDRKNHYLLEDCNTPFDMLISLKKRLSPTQKVRERDLAAAYHKLQQIPKDSDLDDWLAEWQVVYTQCKSLNLPEVYDNRASIDFLNALKSVDIHFSENQLDKIQELEEQGEDCPDVLKLLDRFETRRRISPPTKTRSQPAFATLQGKSLENSKEVNDDTTPPRACLCGEFHLFIECPYLIELIRRPGWEPDAEKLKKINETIEKRPRLYAAVEAARKKVAARNKDRSQDSKPQERNDNTHSIEPESNSAQKRKETSFATSFHISDSYSKLPTYDLHRSFLLDSASTVHICNDFQRFTNYTEAESNDFLIAGNSIVPILGYGTATVYARAPDNSDIHTIRLQNAAYAPTFHTSLISLRRALKGGVRWIIEQSVLSNEIGPICKVFDILDQWVVEYNPIEEENSNTGSVYETFATSRSQNSSITPNDTQPTKDHTVEEYEHQSAQMSASDEYAISIPEKQVIMDISDTQDRIEKDSIDVDEPSSIINEDGVDPFKYTAIAEASNKEPSPTEQLFDSLSLPRLPTPDLAKTDPHEHISQISSEEKPDPLHDKADTEKRSENLNEVKELEEEFENVDEEYKELEPQKILQEELSTPVIAPEPLIEPYLPEPYDCGNIANLTGMPEMSHTDKERTSNIEQIELNRHGPDPSDFLTALSYYRFHSKKETARQRNRSVRAGGVCQPDIWLQPQGHNDSQLVM